MNDVNVSGPVTPATPPPQAAASARDAPPAKNETRARDAARARDDTPADEDSVRAAELLAVLGAIRRISRRAVRHSALAEPLPPARSELLNLAAAHPGISVAEAAHELGLAPNSVSTLVGRLTAEGLLSRGRALDDGRTVVLNVTPSGAARVAQWRDVRAELAGRALSLLAAADRRSIEAAVPALVRLAERMEEL